MATLTSANLRSEAIAAANRYGIDSDLFVRQMQQESGFSIDVALGRDLSSAGAGGVSQFMPDTWTAVVGQHPEIGANPNPSGRFDPIMSLNVGAAHMSDLLQQFGNYRDALVAYNAGPGRVGQPLFGETQTYINNILGGEGMQHEGNGVFNPRNLFGSANLSIQEALDRIGPVPAGTDLETYLLNNGFIPIPGQPGRFFDTNVDEIVDFAPPAGPGGPSDIGPLGLDLQNRRLDLENRKLETQEELERLQLDLQEARSLRENAIAQQNIQIAIQQEERITFFEARAVQLQQQQQEIDFQLQSLQLGLTERGQDITQRGQDINAQLTQLQLQYQDLDSQRRDAIARGDQQLAARIEQRMGFIAESSNAIAQGQQNVDVAGLDLQGQIAENRFQIDLFSQQWQAARAQGDLQGQQDAELRLRAAQQQQTALQQQSLALDAQGLGVQAQTSGGNILTQLANTEQQRLSELQRLSSNPRDFAQLQFALGGGESFIQNLLGGIAPGAQSVTQIGDTPTLGAGFEQLVSMLGQRPAFESALGVGQNLGNFQVPETISLEDILALGALPPLQPLPQFPGAPELSPIEVQDVPQLQFPELPPFEFNPPPPPQIGPTPEETFASLIASGMSAFEANRRLQEMFSGAPPPLQLPPPIGAAPAPPSLPAPPPLQLPPGQQAPTFQPSQSVGTGSPSADTILQAEANQATTGPVSSQDALMQLWREAGLI